MKPLCIAITFFLFSTNGYSTHQVEDYLIFDKDTLYFYDLSGDIDSPLEQLDSISDKIRGYIEKRYNIITISSGCWRGFYAEWKIVDNTLYLSKVFDCGTGKEINVVIEKTLGRKFTNGLLKADWVNGTFWCGKDLIMEESLYLPVYRHRCKFLIEKGKIIEKEVKTTPPIETAPKACVQNDEEIFTIVEVPPLFDGKPAEVGFREYIDKNRTDYDGVNGRVFVEFVIEKDGSISNAKVLRSIDPILDAEALRVINASPKWTPAKQHGKPVRVRYAFPVNFDHYKSNQYN